MIFKAIQKITDEFDELTESAQVVVIAMLIIGGAIIFIGGLVWLLSGAGPCNR